MRCWVLVLAILVVLLGSVTRAAHWHPPTVGEGGTPESATPSGPIPSGEGHPLQRFCHAPAHFVTLPSVALSGLPWEKGLGTPRQESFSISFIQIPPEHPPKA